MRAVVYYKYGLPDVLKLEDIAKPVPGDNEVLIKVHAAAANYADWAFLRGKPYLVRLISGGLLKPKNTILGADIAGRIEAVGKNVKQFQLGDEVFGNISGCGWGGFAEYTCADENALVIKPANISFENAAAVPLAGVTALEGLRHNGHIQPGQKVLINGASGGVGTFAVQIAKTFGAEVTAVCSTRNLEIARSLGADYIIDYTKKDFTKNGQKYDLILAANGYNSIFKYKSSLNPGGIYVMTGGFPAQIIQAMLFGPLISITGNKNVGNHLIKSDKNSLVFLKELLESGKIVPVVDRHYTLSEIAEALRYLGEGHARGKIVITMRNNNKE